MGATKNQSGFSYELRILETNQFGFHLVIECSHSNFTKLRGW